MMRRCTDKTLVKIAVRRDQVEEGQKKGRRVGKINPEKWPLKVGFTSWLTKLKWSGT